MNFRFKLQNQLISANVNPGHDTDSVDNLLKKKTCFTREACLYKTKGDARFSQAVRFKHARVTVTWMNW